MIDETRLAEAMDRLAIREQIDLYADLLNHRDWSSFRNLLTEDMVWTVSDPVNIRIEGREKMMRVVESSEQSRFSFGFQMAHGVVIDRVEGNLARSHHTLHIVFNNACMMGLYYDLLVKEKDGVWRFKRRDYQITYADNVELPGKVYRTLPDPNYKELPRP